MIINNKKDFQEIIDLFQEGKVSTYDDGNSVWLTINQYEYLRDFMSLFTDDELLESELKAYFFGGEINFKLNEVLFLLGLKWDEVEQELEKL